MIKLNYQLCELVTGGSSMTVLANGIVSISDLSAGEIMKVNNLQFTPHGCFDMQGNALNHTVPQNINGYLITLWQYKSDSMGTLDVYEYRLLPA